MSKSDRVEKAVALKYSTESDLAPVVIASGYGDIAEKIIDIAENRGIPVYRDDSVASMLCMLDVGASIPTELYEVIATIYSQILKTASNLQGTQALKDIQNSNTKSQSARSSVKGAKNKLEERSNIKVNNATVIEQKN